MSKKNVTVTLTFDIAADMDMDWVVDMLKGEVLNCWSSTENVSGSYTYNGIVTYEG